jgi:hypothetical protein
MLGQSGSLEGDYYLQYHMLLRVYFVKILIY